MLKQRSIVRARVIDPQGGNSKLRPLVVVSPTSEINSKETFVAVAITGRFSDPLADDEVALPYQSGSNCGQRASKAVCCKVRVVG